VKRAFEHFAAWQLTLPAPKYRRVSADVLAQHRWDGEGGNNGLAEARWRRIRVNALGRNRTAARNLRIKEMAWKRNESTRAVSAKG
jgi:hypothetical protein